FKEGEVLDEIPMSYYFELTLKKRQLAKKGLFENEKKRLLKMAKDGALSGHKEYRQELKRLLKN
ncbi:hypothetical protein C4565_07990, partial [Candidatus Parcubacteria bacterium]